MEVNNLRTFSGNWAVVGSFSRSTEVPDSLFNLETSNFESGTWLFRLGIVGFGDVGVGSANVVIDLLGTCPSQEVVGCMDAEACNYNAAANMDDGTCDYSCCPGPGCCDQGTHWSWESNACVVSNPADINMDGCVQLGDLLSLLGAYGDCPPAESTWECGDSLEYQGYNYETVLIGEQCWFAENLTAANYRNGDAIPSNLSSAEWVVSNDASTVYGEGTAICDNDFSVDFDNCDEAEALNEYGRLYNWHAVSDSRKLCPAGWVVPSDLQWGQMEDFLGVPANELEAIGWRGTTQGMDLKNETGWYSGIGLNAYQFSAKPSGYRWASDGDFSHAGESSGWWTSNATSNTEALYRLLDRENGAIYRQTTDKNFGFAIRCLKNLE